MFEKKFIFSKYVQFCLIFCSIFVGFGDPKQIVGAKEIVSNGGKVKIINIYKQLSTTNIYKKI